MLRPPTPSSARRRARKPAPSSLRPTSAKQPPAVAITGPIGAGKSAALAAFARHGAATISSDDTVHRILRSDPSVHRELVQRFGPDVVGPDGAERAKLAEIVFNHPDELAWLEQLLHPLVVQENLRWREDLAHRREPPPLTVTEVPLLYETGAEKRFDAVVVITAPKELRERRRAMGDDREQRLLPEEEKVARADFAYVNDGTLEELDAFVADVVAKLTA